MGIQKPDMENLDELEELLKFFPVYKRLAEVAETKLMLAVENGYELKHHKVTTGRKSRDWSIPNDELEQHFGDVVYDEAPVKSVAQLEKLLGKRVVEPFVRTTEGSNKLVPLTSILQEVSINASEFN